MRSLLVLALVLVTTVAARGDMPFPGKRSNLDRFQQQIRTVPQMAAVPPPNAFHITVEVSKDAHQPLLVVPRPMLDRVRSQIEVKQGETVSFPNLPWGQLLFALLLAAGGLCLLRGRTRLAFAAALLLTAGVTLGLQHTPLEAAPPQVAKQVRVGDMLIENVRIVVLPEDGELKLTLPPGVLPR